MSKCDKIFNSKANVRLYFRECDPLQSHDVFLSPLSFREFLGQGWMKVDKTDRTPYIMKTSQHFNDVSLSFSPV